MRSSINLASQPFLDYRPFLLATGILGGLALVVTVALGITAASTWRETTTTRGKLRALENQVSRLAAEQRALESQLRAPGTYEQLEQVYHVNQLIQRKTFSWTQLFFDVQERLPGQVRVLAITPSQRDDGSVQVEMRLGAGSQSALIDFLQALEQGKKFREVALHAQGEARSGPDAIDARVTTIYVGD